MFKPVYMTHELPGRDGLQVNCFSNIHHEQKKIITITRLKPFILASMWATLSSPLQQLPLSLSFSQTQSHLTSTSLGRHENISKLRKWPRGDFRQARHFNIEKTNWVTTWKLFPKRKEIRLSSNKSNKDHRDFV